MEIMQVRLVWAMFSIYIYVLPSHFPCYEHTSIRRAIVARGVDVPFYLLAQNIRTLSNGSLSRAELEPPHSGEARARRSSHHLVKPEDCLSRFQRCSPSAACWSKSSHV